MTAQTAMSAAMKRAGMNLTPNRLAIAADEAMAKCHGNKERAAAALLREIGKTELLDEMALFYLRNYRAAGADQSCGATQPSTVSPGTTARSIVEPSAAQVATNLAVKTKIALTVFDRIKTARGVPFGNIYYRELASMTEDGDLAREVKASIGHVSNNDRHKPVRELMTPREFMACCRKVGRSDYGA